tara:strand:+ start:594 stop:1199 length:606 start_codon:yes stop_codon:yes gene_type:complete
MYIDGSGMGQVVFLNDPKTTKSSFTGPILIKGSRGRSDNLLGQASNWLGNQIKTLAKNPTVSNIVDSVAPQLQAAAGQKIKKYAQTNNLGVQVGTKIGCATAKAFEDAIPKFPIFGSDPDYKGCPKPQPKTGTKGLGFLDLDIEGTLTTALEPQLAEAEKVAARIAKPRIEARLKPWFIGLPIVGLAAGIGIGYFVWGRKK